MRALSLNGERVGEAIERGEPDRIGFTGPGAGVQESGLSVFYGGPHLFLKGERVEEELTLARKRWTMTASVEQSLSDRRGVILRLQQVAREPRQA